MKNVISLGIVLFLLISCADDEFVQPEIKIVQLTANGGFVIEIIARVDSRGTVEIAEVGAYINTSAGASGFELQTVLVQSSGAFEDYRGSLLVDAPGTYYVRPFVKDASGKVYEGSEVEVNTGSVVVADFNPKVGGAGVIVNITGSNFTNGTIPPEVFIGGIKADVISFTEGTITARVPTGIVADPVKIIVKTLAGEFVAQGEFEWLKGVWTKMPDYNGTFLTDQSLSYTLGQTGYVGINSVDNKIWGFDVQTQIWSESNTYPGEATISSRGFQFQSGIPAYISDSNQEWWYISATNSWIQKPAFPSPTAGAVAFTFNNGNESFVGKVYEPGGGSKIGIWKKQSTDMLWTQISDFPVTLSTARLSLAVDGKTYLIAGAGAFASQSVLQYDPLSDEWTQLADGTFPKRSNPVGFVLGGKIYVGGGLGESGSPLADFYEFTPSTGEWLRIANLPTTNGYPRFVSFVVQEKGYVVQSNLFHRLEIE